MLTDADITAAIHKAYCRANYCCSVDDQNFVRKLAKDGNHLAEAYLALGRSASPCRQEVVNFVHMEESKGNPYAQFILGTMHEKGLGVPKNPASAFIYYQKAAMYDLAFAQVNLSRCYELGIGVQKNEYECARYAKLAADQNEPVGHCQLGMCYKMGKGVTTNKEEAVRYYRLAVDQGCVAAQFRLGCCLQSGAGVAKDVSQAFHYYKICADKSFIQAEYQVAVCYEQGIGVAANAPEAVRYYQRAAKHGNANAQYSLGLCYQHGRGVVQDTQEAERYFKLAAAQGHAKAVAALASTVSTAVSVSPTSIGTADTTLAANKRKATAELPEPANHVRTQPQTALDIFARDKRAEALYLLGSYGSDDPTTVHYLLVTMWELADPTVREQYKQQAEAQPKVYGSKSLSVDCAAIVHSVTPTSSSAGADSSCKKARSGVCSKT